MKSTPIAVLAGLVAGVLSVGLATDSPPRPKPYKFRKTPWSISAEDGKTITPERPLDLPGPYYADFDLRCRIELPENADVDLIFRKVEHWGEGHMLLFHTRFAALRMSSRKDGPGLLTREQLLFGGDVGGVRIAPGAPGASVELECRGRCVTRASVNGIELPPIETADDFGNLALISRHGVAVVHDFTVEPWPAAESNLHWFIGAGLGALLGFLLGLLGAHPANQVVSLLVFGMGGLVAKAAIFDHLLPAVGATNAGLAAGASCLWLVALILAIKAVPVLPRILLALVAGGAGSLFALEIAVRSEGDRFTVFEDDRLDLVFGPQSGTAGFDAAMRMLKCQYTAHPLRARRYDVLLLGGKQFMDYNDAGGDGRNLSVALPVQLRGMLRMPAGKEVYCAAIPTELPNAYQQFTMYADYYKDFRPKVVVLGLCSDEDDAHRILRSAPRTLAKTAAQPHEHSWSVLLDLYLRTREPERSPQTADDLRATLEDLYNVCVAQDSRLVLAIDKSLSAGFQEAVFAFASARSVPFVTGFAIDEGHYPVEPLAEVVLRELIR